LHCSFPSSIDIQVRFDACAGQVWDVATKKLKLDLPGHADEVYAVDWSPDGASVASGGKDRVLRIWRQ
jgi:ribosome assembly protein 4